MISTEGLIMEENSCSILGLTYGLEEALEGTNKGERILETGNKIAQKYLQMAQKEFDEYLESVGCESTMGMIISCKDTIRQ